MSVHVRSFGSIASSSQTGLTLVAGEAVTRTRSASDPSGSAREAPCATITTFPRAGHLLKRFPNQRTHLIAPELIAGATWGSHGPRGDESPDLLASRTRCVRDANDPARHVPDARPPGDPVNGGISPTVRRS